MPRSNAEPTAEIIADAITGFIHAHDAYRKVVASAAPLERPVNIRTSTWHPWLTEGGRAGSSSYVGPMGRRHQQRSRAVAHGSEPFAILLSDDILNAASQHANGHHRVRPEAGQ